MVNTISVVKLGLSAAFAIAATAAYFYESPTVAGHFVASAAGFYLSNALNKTSLENSRANRENFAASAFFGIVGIAAATSGVLTATGHIPVPA